MKEDGMLRIVVPASTANLGPGFDSIGLAVSRYLTLEVRLADEWKFVPRSSEVAAIPAGMDNLIYQVAAQVAQTYGCTLPSCFVDVYSNIPFTRGLGSSAAAVVAGIELANELAGLSLSLEQKMRFASCYEGHPDNVGASLYGGLVIGSHRQEETDVVHVPDVQLDLVAVIPSYELETEKARSVLPQMMAREDAVEASAVSNVLVAALLTKRWELAGKMMSCDLFHQPYRKELVPQLSLVEKLAMQYGAFGVALSGAGPTILAFAEPGKGMELKEKLAPYFPDCAVEWLTVEQKGSQVYKMSFEK
ncbi:homoserine kinase [Parageobacillus thermoglucosidasius]|uniref:homoserine kinase n=1 Tax=Parageobacillus thermoglucosidasius TaxID=1426 RepID=UPI000B55F9E3|nr:homoserine kinase [Parageobacillus thermoglucosidasius]MBY6266844.1 homoserine kinase [Parageobacillus thermoglucosidasius]OUM92430.1 MAG: homoserine kinase [Parageobacillus thermoglucosidasius]